MLITERTAHAYRVYDPSSDHMYEVSYEHILNGFTVQGTPVSWQATTCKIGVSL